MVVCAVVTCISHSLDVVGDIEGAGSVGARRGCCGYLYPRIPDKSAIAPQYVVGVLIALTNISLATLSDGEGFP